jgi:putative transposase
LIRTINALLHAVGLDASLIGTLLLSLSTIAGTEISNPSWVNFQSAGWVSFQSAPTVMVHSDQGSQYSSSDWRSFLKANNLVASMSRRGNCHDNAVAESFFKLLKRERIKRKIYTTRQDARGDVFDYIEMFYNSKRRHGFNNQLSPVEFEKRYTASLQGV